MHIQIWQKLIFNTAVNTIGGATGMTVGQTGTTKPGRRLLTSMTADIEAGRPTEVESIGGAIEEAGREHGVPTPVLSALCDVVRARSM